MAEGGSEKFEQVPHNHKESTANLNRTFALELAYRLMVKHVKQDTTEPETETRQR